jgi:hypothetical protein
VEQNIGASQIDHFVLHLLHDQSKESESKQGVRCADAIKSRLGSLKPGNSVHPDFKKTGNHQVVL